MSTFNEKRMSMLFEALGIKERPKTLAIMILNDAMAIDEGKTKLPSDFVETFKSLIGNSEFKVGEYNENIRCSFNCIFKETGMKYDHCWGNLYRVFSDGHYERYDFKPETIDPKHLAIAVGEWYKDDGKASVYYTFYLFDEEIKDLNSVMEILHL